MMNLFLTLLDSEGEKSKFEKVYEKYRKLMHYVAKGILADDQLAEDAVQEAFFRIAKNFYKVGEIDCPQTKNFVVIIVRNAALTIVKKEETASSIEEIDSLSDGEVRQDDSTFEKVEISELIGEILNLPETYRYPLYLYGVYDYKMAEIANLLGITTETAKKRVQRGRQILRNNLEKGV